MSSSPTEIVGNCGQCGTAIAANHPYAWCSSCGTSLPAELKARLPSQQPRPAGAGPDPRQDGVPLMVEGYPVACPICRHDRFRTRRAQVESGAMFNMEMIIPKADTYICLRCSYVLWFMR